MHGGGSGGIHRRRYSADRVDHEGHELRAPAVDAAQVPNSTGTERPRTKAPANATDCHAHIYDARFESTIPPLPHATVNDYRLLQQRTGTSRVVIVTPRNYVVDNSFTLDAIRQFGAAARGVAVVKPDITGAELQALYGFPRKT
jgi:D-galactarolactone isomerase